MDPPAPTELSAGAAIVLYIFIVFFGAALLAPRLYIAIQRLAVDIPNLAWLAAEPFHRYVNRCLIILAVIGLWPFVKALGIQSWAALGVKCTKRHCLEGLLGFGWGFVCLALLVVLTVTAEVRLPNLEHTQAEWLKYLRNAGLAALLVGFLEELLFRGAFFNSLRRNHAFWSAAILSSALYALLHFFERPLNPRYVEWNSGLIILGRMLRGFIDLHTLIPGFLNLTLVGLILALAFERTGAICFSFGLHAGFIFWLKSYDFLTKAAPAQSSSFWGSVKLVDGWITTALLSILLLVLTCLLRIPRSAPKTLVSAPPPEATHAQ
jgi:uncharacterized protein